MYSLTARAAPCERCGYITYTYTNSCYSCNNCGKVSGNYNGLITNGTTTTDITTSGLTATDITSITFPSLSSSHGYSYGIANVAFVKKRSRVLNLI